MVWTSITQSIGSSEGTFHNVFMDSLNLDDDTIVYFLENDYIHAPNSMNALFDGFDIGTLCHII